MPSIVELNATPVFQRNYDAWDIFKILVDQGSTRSSKTYSIAQLFIIKLLETTGRTLTIARKTSPSMHSSVMRDFFTILRSMGIYEDWRHNKSFNEYNLHGNLVEFISMDVAEKKKGAKRDFLWLNEATEFSYEDFFQLSIRTSEKIVLDYNPAYEFHWIYDRVLTRKDAILIHSTYKDNSFLEKSIVEEIERLKDVDETYWKIYGLGERAATKALIYSNWDLVDMFPDNCDEVLYGVDFGFNNPSTVIKVGVKDKVDIFIQQMLYETHLTNNDLIEKLKEIIPEFGRASVLLKADSAEPDRIEEISRAGFWIEGSVKGKNSVKDGIDVVKRKRLHIVKDNSAELLKEIQFYKWKEDKNGNVLDEPVKFNDHAMSGMRYAIEDIDEPKGGETKAADWDFIGRR